MIIRSQDKTKIFNFKQIRKIDCDTGMMVVDNTALIGEYTTEEKAIKVLDMICKAYENYRGGNVYEHSIFNMPSDAEVEV